MHHSFRATVQLEGKTATGIRVPPEVVGALGGGKRPAVRVTLNGYTYRSTVAPFAGGVFMLPLAREHRTAAGVEAGQDQARVSSGRSGTFQPISSHPR